MRIRPVHISMLCAVLSAAGPAWADKGGKGHGADKVPAAKALETRHAEDEEIFGFNEKEAAVIGGVLKHLYGGDDKDVEVVRPSRGFCPPGLAKKNNGCMPPGQAKKYSIGHPLPDDVPFSDLPEELRKALGVPPKGRKYVQVDQDVLLITEGTNLVLDAIGIGKGAH